MAKPRSFRLPNGFVVLGAAVLVGCANYTPRVKPTLIPTGAESFLYGRFYIELDKGMHYVGGFDGHPSMGFKVECEDHATYLLRFANSDPVAAITIHPSRCSFTTMVYTNADGKIFGERPAPERAAKDMLFEAGKAYYLGDFAAWNSFRTTGAGVGVIYGAAEWRLTSDSDNYQATTEELHTRYPNLVSIPTNKRLILEISHDRAG